MEYQVPEFLVCWVNQLARWNLIILKPLLTEWFEEWKITFFVSFYEFFRNTNSSYADYFKVGPSILFLSHTGWLRRDTLQFWTNQCLCTSLIIRSILQMVIQCTLKLANWAEIKIYVRRNLRLRSVSDISCVKKKKKKKKRNKTKNSQYEIGSHDCEDWAQEHLLLGDQDPRRRGRRNLHTAFVKWWRFVRPDEMTFSLPMLSVVPPMDRLLWG